MSQRQRLIGSASDQVTEIQLDQHRRNVYVVHEADEYLIIEVWFVTQFGAYVSTSEDGDDGDEEEEPNLWRN